MVGWVGGWVGRSNPHRGDVPFFASPESLDRSEERGFIPASLLPFYRQSHDIHGFRGSAKSEKEKKNTSFKENTTRKGACYAVVRRIPARGCFGAAVDCDASFLLTFLPRNCGFILLSQRYFVYFHLHSFTTRLSLFLLELCCTIDYSCK